MYIYIYILHKKYLIHYNNKLYNLYIYKLYFIFNYTKNNIFLYN